MHYTFYLFTYLITGAVRIGIVNKEFRFRVEGQLGKRKKHFLTFDYISKDTTFSATEVSGYDDNSNNNNNNRLRMLYSNVSI